MIVPELKIEPELDRVPEFIVIIPELDRVLPEFIVIVPELMIEPVEMLLKRPPVRVTVPELMSVAMFVIVPPTLFWMVPVLFTVPSLFIRELTITVPEFARIPPDCTLRKSLVYVVSVTPGLTASVMPDCIPIGNCSIYPDDNVVVGISTSTLNVPVFVIDASGELIVPAPATIPALDIVPKFVLGLEFTKNDALFLMVIVPEFVKVLPTSKLPSIPDSTVRLSPEFKVSVGRLH